MFWDWKVTEWFSKSRMTDEFTRLEESLEIWSEPVHDLESMLCSLDRVTAAAPVTRHTQGGQTPEKLNVH